MVKLSVEYLDGMLSWLISWPFWRRAKIALPLLIAALLLLMVVCCMWWPPDASNQVGSGVIDLQLCGSAQTGHGILIHWLASDKDLAPVTSHLNKDDWFISLYTLLSLLLALLSSIVLCANGARKHTVGVLFLVAAVGIIIAGASDYFGENTELRTLITEVTKHGIVRDELPFNSGRRAILVAHKVRIRNCRHGRECRPLGSVPARITGPAGCHRTSGESAFRTTIIPFRRRKGIRRREGVP
jgi:hypothetical protein